MSIINKKCSNYETTETTTPLCVKKDCSERHKCAWSEYLPGVDDPPSPDFISEGPQNNRRLNSY